MPIQVLDAERTTRTVSTVDDLLAKDVAASASVGALDSSATNATLRSANADRKGLIVQNIDDGDLCLKYGATATGSDFTVKIASGGYWEMPKPVYTGRIDAIWIAPGSGAAHYTEL
jgi:hypothetical protein